MSYKIIVDSCCDLNEEMKKWDNLEVVPLTLQIGDYIVPDDENFNQEDFIDRMTKSSDFAKSACPSPQAFADACDGDYDDIYIITITDKLSGCYNSALQGVSLYQETNDNCKNIHVFNSLATSGLETLIAMEIKKKADGGMEFDKIVEDVEKYIVENCGLYFCLESFDSLKSNGRLYNVAANVIEALRVKLIGARTKDGKIAIAGKDITQKRLFIKLAGLIGKDCAGSDFKGKQCIISHVCCEEKAKAIKDILVNNTGFAEEDITILKASGLNSLYACDGGTIIAFNF